MLRYHLKQGINHKEERVFQLQPQLSRPLQHEYGCQRSDNAEDRSLSEGSPAAQPCDWTQTDFGVPHRHHEIDMQWKTKS
jgi:hypothetical protein